MGIIFAILIFSFIVFFHELGHFTLAKLNGIDVQEFAIGMGPTLFSKEYKGTVYAVHLLPPFRLTRPLLWLLRFSTTT